MSRIKEIIKVNHGIITAVILISVMLSGCSKNPEPEVVKTNNINQSPQASNNNSVTSPSNNSTPFVNNNSTANANKKALSPVKEPTPQIGSGGTDMSLFAQARVALSSDEKLINAVILDIKEGNATLTGTVPSEALKTKAGQLVQGVQGIKTVKNNLRVSP